jgi:hypothetical protein
MLGLSTAHLISITPAAIFAAIQTPWTNGTMTSPTQDAGEWLNLVHKYQIVTLFPYVLHELWSLEYAWKGLENLMHNFGLPEVLQVDRYYQLKSAYDNTNWKAKTPVDSVVFTTLSDAADDALGSLQTGNFLTTCEGRCNLRVAKKLCWQAAQTRGHISKLMKGFARICREGPENEPEPKKSPLDRYTEKELGKVCQGCREVLASQCEHVATKVDSHFQEVMVEHYATSL